jgi:hypothetical protein
MKKIFYLILVAITSLILSSYIPQQNNSEKVTSKDSMFVKASVSVNVPSFKKGDENVYKALTKALESFTESNNAKLEFLKEVSKPEDLSRMEYLCMEVNITPDELFKKARADTMINFISTLLSIILLIWGTTIMINKSKDVAIPWSHLIIVAVFFITLTFFIKEYLGIILSFIFNNEYSTIKQVLEIIK